MQARIEKTLRMLRKEKADALLVWNSEGSGQPVTRWLSGFTGSSSILFLTRAKQFLITDGRYAAQSREETNGYEIFIASPTRPSLTILHWFAKRRKVKRVLFDGAVTPYSVVEDLRKELAEIVFSSQKRALQELRIAKEKGELRILSKAATIACHAFTKLLPFIEIGMTEREVAGKLESLCLSEGADDMAFPTITASGKNGALPHAKLTDKKIQKGELVTIDFGVLYRGYVSDMTRTIAIGQISPRLFNIYEAVRIAQERGCREAKAGMMGEKLDAVCRNILIRKGYGKYFTHGTGHGIGMEVHELPIVAPGKGGANILRVGSVITCEPGVYIRGVGGVRIEDTLALTKRGNVNLTASIPKTLLVIGDENR